LVTKGWRVGGYARFAAQSPDRYTILGECGNCRIGFLLPQIAFILQVFSIGEGFRLIVAPMAVRIARMDLRTASRKAALAFSMWCQRSATWMARESLGGGFAISTAPVGRHDPHLWMVNELSLDCRDLPIGQEPHHSAPLKIADNRSIVMIPAEMPSHRSRQPSSPQLEGHVLRRTTGSKVSLLTGSIGR
jgi:hypothetical protein